MTCYVISIVHTLTEYSSGPSVCEDSLSYCKIEKCESFNWMNDVLLPKLCNRGS